MSVQSPVITILRLLRGRQVTPAQMAKIEAVLFQSVTAPLSEAAKLEKSIQEWRSILDSGVDGIQQERTRYALELALRKLGILTQQTMMEVTGLAGPATGNTPLGTPKELASAIRNSIAQLKTMLAGMPAGEMSGHVTFIMMNVRKLMQAGDLDAAHILLVGLSSQLVNITPDKYVFNPTEI